MRGGRAKAVTAGVVALAGFAAAGAVGAGMIDERDDDIGGVAVEVLAATVVDRGGSGGGVASGELANGLERADAGHHCRSALASLLFPCYRNRNYVISMT